MQNMRRVQPMRRVSGYSCTASGLTTRQDYGYATRQDEKCDETVRAMPMSVCERKEQESRGYCLSGMPSLAMVYAPCHEFGDLYELSEGISNGTIFRALNMPFKPGYGKRGDVR